jgi:hypothetical protein
MSQNKVEDICCIMRSATQHWGMTLNYRTVRKTRSCFFEWGGIVQNPVEFVREFPDGRMQVRLPEGGAGYPKGHLLTVSKTELEQ